MLTLGEHNSFRLKLLNICVEFTEHRVNVLQVNEYMYNDLSSHRYEFTTDNDTNKNIPILFTHRYNF